MKRNEHDIINSVIDTGTSLRRSLQQLTDFLDWYAANYKSAKAPATQEQLNRFQNDHRLWEIQRDKEQRREADYKTMFEIAQHREHRDIGSPNEVCAKVDEYLNSRSLNGIDTWLLSRLVASGSDSDDIDKRIEAYATHIQELKSSAIDVGLEPVKPELENPALNQEMVDRTASISALDETIKLQTVEFESVAREWDQTAEWDFKPISDIKRDLSIAEITATVDFINKAVARAGLAKAELSERQNQVDLADATAAKARYCIKLIDENFQLATGYRHRHDTLRELYNADPYGPAQRRAIDAFEASNRRRGELFEQIRPLVKLMVRAGAANAPHLDPVPAIKYLDSSNVYPIESFVMGTKEFLLRLVPILENKEDADNDVGVGVNAKDRPDESNTAAIAASSSAITTGKENAVKSNEGFLIQADPGKSPKPSDLKIYYSVGAAISENLDLTETDLDGVYRWLRDNGVEIKGEVFRPTCNVSSFKRQYR